MAAVLGALRNRFFLIRHGLAQSNVESVLVSDPEIGILQYGLTDEGRRQAKEAAAQFKSLLKEEEIDKIQLVSSDFRRTRETAEILHSELQVKRPIRFEAALRERGLGSLNLTAGHNVHEMWRLDHSDPTHTTNGVESITSLVIRMTRIIKDLNDEYYDQVLILVSHGDPCQCLHSVFEGISPNEFRNGRKGFSNCEIRELKEE